MKKAKWPVMVFGLTLGVTIAFLWSKYVDPKESWGFRTHRVEVSGAAKNTSKAQATAPANKCSTKHNKLSVEMEERRKAIKVKPIEAVVHRCPGGKHWAVGNYQDDQAENSVEYTTVCTDEKGEMYISANMYFGLQGMHQDYDYAYCAANRKAK